MCPPGIVPWHAKIVPPAIYSLVFDAHDADMRAFPPVPPWALRVKHQSMAIDIYSHIQVAAAGIVKPDFIAISFEGVISVGCSDLAEQNIKRL